jgi:hypothetical protein
MIRASAERRFEWLKTYSTNFGFLYNILSFRTSPMKTFHNVVKNYNAESPDSDINAQE